MTPLIISMNILPALAVLCLAQSGMHILTLEPYPDPQPEMSSQIYHILVSVLVSVSVADFLTSLLNEIVTLAEMRINC